MMKNTFYCTLIALFGLKLLKFLYWIFGNVKERTDLKHKTCEVAIWCAKQLQYTSWSISQEVKVIR